MLYRLILIYLCYFMIFNDLFSQGSIREAPLKLGLLVEGGSFLWMRDRLYTLNPGVGAMYSISEQWEIGISALYQHTRIKTDLPTHCDPIACTGTGTETITTREFLHPVQLLWYPLKGHIRSSNYIGVSMIPGWQIHQRIRTDATDLTGDPSIEQITSGPEFTPVWWGIQFGKEVKVSSRLKIRWEGGVRVQFVEAVDAAYGYLSCGIWYKAQRKKR